jgi:TMEM175 potassium channel family protein
MARGANRWWGVAERGGTDRLEAFSDGVFAIAITLLILEVRVEQGPEESLAEALHHALPEIGAFAASFLQIGIMWANHHALFRLIDRVDQLLLLFNLVLLGCVSFLPLPTRLVAEHTDGGDARTAVLLYGGTLVANAVAFNLIWYRTLHADLLVAGVSPAFVHDVTIRYALGLISYAVATLIAFVSPLATVLITVMLALVFLLGPSPRSGLAEDGT